VACWLVSHQKPTYAEPLSHLETVSFHGSVYFTETRHHVTGFSSSIVETIDHYVDWVETARAGSRRQYSAMLNRSSLLRPNSLNSLMRNCVNAADSATPCVRFSFSLYNQIIKGALTWLSAAAVARLAVLLSLCEDHCSNGPNMCMCLVFSRPY